MNQFFFTLYGETSTSFSTGGSTSKCCLSKEEAFDLRFTEPDSLEASFTSMLSLKPLVTIFVSLGKDYFVEKLLTDIKLCLLSELSLILLFASRSKV